MIKIAILLTVLLSCTKDISEPMTKQSANAKTISFAYDIAIIGESYKPNEQALYLSHVEIAKQGLLVRPPLKQRALQITFHILSWNNKFSCGYGNNGPNGTLECNFDRIRNKVYASGIIPDVIICLVKNKNLGSGTNTVIVGMALPEIHDRASLVAHEVGHGGFGLEDGSGGIMGSIASNATFTPAHQDWINGVLDNTAGVFIDLIPPTTSISYPLNGATFQHGEFFTVLATAQGDPMRIELYIDGNIAVGNAPSTIPYWDGAYWANNNTGITYFINTSAYPDMLNMLSVGTHTIGIKAVDAAYNETLSTVNIIIQ